MQVSEEGEFYPEKDLDKNYRIPRRPDKPMPKGNNYNHPQFNASLAASQTPLANSYYNYPYDPSAASAYYQNYSQYYQQYGQQGSIGYNNSSHANSNSQPQASNATFPNRNNTAYNFTGYNKGNYNAGSSGRNVGAGAMPPLPPEDPIKQNIYKTLNDIKETPKNYNKNTYFQNTVPDVSDASLPKELKLLFQPLYCKLCSAQLSSNQTAKMHYKSKNHDKKVRKWLIEYCEKTGEPLPKRAKENQKEDPDKNPTWFHCDICDLDLTGKMHAESHYMGKNHQKAVMGYKAPAGQGYYDESGKWVRTKGSKSKSYNFENGEDNFGMAFKRTASSSESSSTEPAAKKKKESQAPSKFHCDVCDVNTTCQEQLDNHFRGQKHMKKLKLLGLAKYSDQREIIEKSAQSSSLSTAPSSIADSSNDRDLNLSVYRTPSGDYYCPSCNITSNSEPQFVQHMRSKNHAKKAAQKKSG